jgi:prolyl-tRNA editing enzyme YbaK/EbsC (Cys-tRNA(Pro) deacylase)
MREKVIKVARELGLDVDVKTLGEPTRTVPEAAAAVGCDAAEIAKSIVFIADGEPVLCIASGSHRVDLEKLCDVLDCAEVRQAAPDEVRAATGFSVGGVPPFGHTLPVVLDEALLGHDRVWAAGGDGNTLFQVDPRRLADCVEARIASIAALDGSA